MRTAKPLLIALALIFTTGASAQDPAKQPAQDSPAKTETCTVQGTVVAAATGVLLKSAWVVLTAPTGGPAQYIGLQRFADGPSFKEITDVNGHFVINGIPAGKYEFHAGKSGYVSEDYRPDGGPPQATLELESGEKLDKVQFRLAKAAVIIGRITDEAGEPVTGIEVDALAAGTRVTESWNLTNPGRLAITNDLGEYRIYDLPPGGYYLAATDYGFTDLRSTVKLDAIRGRRPRSHPTVYYPGVTRGSEAQKVRVKAGQEARIDFSLRAEKLLTVSGQVLGPDGEPAAEANVALEPQDPSPNVILKLFGTTSTDAKGNFMFKDVLPGSYVVSAMFTYAAPSGESAASPSESEYWTGQRIDADGDDVSGLELEPSELLKLSGKVSTTTGSKLDFHDLDIHLETEGERPHYAWASAKEDGTFTIDKARPTTYLLTVPALPAGWYVRSAFFGKQNVLEDGLQLADVDTDAHESLNITVSPGAGQIEGIVLNGDAPVLGVVVRFFSARVNQHQTGRSQLQALSAYSGRTDKDGHFIIKNVVPGKYRALVFPNENDDEGSPPEEDDTIVLVEKESKTLQFKLPGKKE